MFKLQRIQWAAILGDVLVIAAVTLAGFATHNTLGTAGARIFATFFPLLVAWVLLGAHVGVFDPERLQTPRQLWRPFWAMILAAPLFGLLRALTLGVDAVSATFIMVLGGIAALSMFAWRVVFVFLLAPRVSG